MNKDKILKVVDYFFGICFKISIFLSILHFIGFFSDLNEIYYISIVLFIICIIIAQIQRKNKG